MIAEGLLVLTNQLLNKLFCSPCHE
jgi:hypothetical protein